MNPQLQSVLNMLPQPALVLERGQILWCNAAASALHLQELPITELLGQAEPFLQEEAEGSCTRYRLQIQSTPYEVCVRPLGEALVLIATPLSFPVPLRDTSALAVALRHPLQELITAADNLFESMPEERPIRMTGSAAEVNRSIYRLQRLCGQLSEAGRLLEEDHPAERRSICLSGFLDRFSESCVPLLKAADYLWEYSPLSKAVYAYVDAPLLERALYQLLANAMTYSPKGSKIRLYTEIRDRLFIIHVEDEGEGISPEARTLLFSPQSSPLQRDPRSGLGLGLPLAEKIAQLHGGHLLLRQLSGGSCASLCLSLEPAPISLKSFRFLSDSYGGRDHGLVELSCVLPAHLYDPEEIES